MHRIVLGVEVVNVALVWCAGPRPRGYDLAPFTTRSTGDRAFWIFEELNGQVLAKGGESLGASSRRGR